VTFVHRLQNADHVEFALRLLLDDPDLREFDLTSPVLSRSTGKVKHLSVLDSARKAVRVHPHCSKARLVLTLVQRVVEWQRRQPQMDEPMEIDSRRCDADGNLLDDGAGSDAANADSSGPQPSAPASTPSVGPTPMEVDGHEHATEDADITVNEFAQLNACATAFTVPPISVSAPSEAAAACSRPRRAH
jgi:hypothetical protein